MKQCNNCKYLIYILQSLVDIPRRNPGVHIPYCHKTELQMENGDEYKSINCGFYKRTWYKFWVK